MWKGLPYRASAVMGQTLRQRFFNKSILIALFFLSIPPIISIYILFDTPDDLVWIDLFSNMGLMMYLQILILLYSLIYGTTLIHEDIEKRTATYLTTRNLKRGEIVLYKYLGLVLSLVLLFSISISLNYFILGLNGSMSELFSHIDLLLGLLFVSAMAIVAYTALFTFIGIVIKRPLMIGLIFAFIWEIFITNLESNIRIITIMYYPRSIFSHFVPRGEIIDITGLTDATTATIVLICFSLVFLFIGFGVFSRKDLH